MMVSCKYISHTTGASSVLSYIHICFRNIAIIRTGNNIAGEEYQIYEGAPYTSRERIPGRVRPLSVRQPQTTTSEIQY